MRYTWSTVLSLGLVTVAVSADAGQFKRLNASTLVPGAQIQAYASPQNQGAAMEMDVYEYLSGAAAYRCRILSNSTGRPLNLNLIGVNGTIVASCTAPAPGFCELPFLLHAGNLAFQCTVSTGNGSPVNPSGWYSFAVQRQPLVLAGREASPAGQADASGIQK